MDLPEVGATLTAGQAFGTIESVKAVSELFAPVGGEVTEVNTALKNKPEQVNAKPHDTWMIKMRLADPGEASSLLDSAAYQSLTGEQSHHMNLDPLDQFARRHIGPSPDDLKPMLDQIGVSSLDALIDEAIPASIRLSQPLDLPPAESESQYLTRLKEIARKNKVFRSFIGLGYYDTLTPSVDSSLPVREPGLVYALHALPG